MRIERLLFRRLPGIPDPLALDGLSPAVNLVVGPNAAGKTSICRAVRSLLWPQVGVPDKLSAEAHLVDSGATLLVEHDGGATTWRADGELRDRPVLPPPHLAHCYTMTIEDLIAEGAEDLDLAHRIAVEMAGGYDMSAALAAFHTKARFGRTERQAVDEASRQLRRRKATHEALRQRERDLARLEEQRSEAALARDRLKTLQAARELLEARHRHDGLERLMGEYPEGMDRLNGQELDRLDEVQKDLSEARDERQELEQRHLAARAERDGAGFGDSPPLPAALEELRGHLARVRALEMELAQAGQRRDEAAQRQGAAATTLGHDDALPQPGSIDPDSLDGLDRFIERAQEHRHQRQAIESVLQQLGDPLDIDVDRLHRAVSSLRSWLANPPAPRPSPWPRIALVAAVLAGLMVAAFLAVLIHPAWGGLALAVLLIGVLVIVARTGAPPLDHRAALREQYEQTGCPAPDAWDEQTVRDRLDELEEELVRGRLDAQNAVRRAEALANLERLEHETAELDEQRQGIISAVLIDPEASDLSLAVLAGRLQRFLNASEEAAAETGSCQALQEQIVGRLDRIGQLLAPFGTDRPADGDTAASAIAALERRCSAHENAERSLREIAGRVQQVEATIARKRDRIDHLYRQAGLETADEPELRRRLGLLQQHGELSSQLQRERSRLAEGEEQLRDEASLRSCSLHELEGLIRRTTETESQYDRIIEQIKEIEAQVQLARAGHDIEEALDDLQRAEDALSACREQALEDAAARLMLEQARLEHEREGQPAVLRRASDLFARFTHFGYQLRVTSDPTTGSAFKALDTTAQRRQELSTLSTGTRTQLLLAVRLAFATAAEAGGPLPLFLDEALGTSDPGRYHEAMESLLGLAADGRQLFYFTFEPAHADRWERAAADRGLPIRRIDLGAARASAIAGSMTTTTGTPPADGPAEPAAPPTVVDPRQPVTALPLSCLLPDEDDLRARLAGRGVEQVGPLLAMLEGGAHDEAVTGDQEQRLRDRVLIAEGFLDAWQIGRGPAVDRAALLKSGAVTGRFIDGLAEMARELGGSAADLIRSIRHRDDDRCRGFHESKLEKLEQDLRQQGHLDDRTPLEPPALFDTVAQIVHASRPDVPRHEIDLVAGSLWAAAI